MSDKGQRGLGDLDWLNDRSQAEASMYAPAESESHSEGSQRTDTATDQGKRSTTRKSASTSASTSASGSRRSSASIKASKAASRKGGQQRVTPTAVDEAPPPPGRQREARTQFNHRILMDRHVILEGYKTEHGATWQGIVDQMVDEYLVRRGLLPESNDDQ